MKKSRRKKSCRKKSISLVAALFWVGLVSNSGAAEWEDLSPGLRFLTQTSGSEKAPVYFVAVDPAHYRLDILRARDQEKSRLSLSQLIQNREVLVAINASFFDEEGHAMGLVIRDGQQLSPLRPTSWGIFQIVSGTPSIIHTRDYRASPRRQLAIQSGPRLVINNTVPTFKDKSIAPRSGVCVTKEGELILAATPGFLTLKQWAQALQAHCPNALNLDGGSSTQFYVKAKDLTLPGGEPIPNALAVLPR